MRALGINTLYRLWLKAYKTAGLILLACTWQRTADEDMTAAANAAANVQTLHRGTGNDVAMQAKRPQGAGGVLPKAATTNDQ